MHNLIRSGCFKKQIINDTQHLLMAAFKMRAGVTAALTRAPLYELSQLGAAADYLLIK